MSPARDFFSTMVFMKTRQLTMSAMLCAMYGALLLISNLSGTFLLDYFPFFFALPAFAAGCLYGWKSWTALAAMLLMTFLLSPMICWLQAPCFVAAGAITGIGRHQKWNDVWTGLACITLLGICFYLQMSVFASVLGYSFEDSDPLYQMMKNWLSPQMILLITSMAMGLIQGFVVMVFSILLQLKLPSVLPPWEPAPLPKLSFWIVPVFIVLSVVVFALMVVLEWQGIYTDLLFLFWLIGYCVLVFYGWQQGWLKKNRSRQAGFLYNVMAWIPVLNAGYALMGLISLIRQHQMRKQR